MEREVVKNLPHRGEGLCGAPTESTSTDFVLQWGNRKRLRCMKFQIKDDSSDKTTVRVDRRVVRTDKDPSTSTATVVAATAATKNNHNNLNLRRHPPSTSPHRILRSSETLCAMRGQSNGMRSSSSPETGRGGEEKAQAKKVSNNHNNHHHHHHHHHNHNENRNGGVGGASPSSETAQDSKKGGGGEGSPSGSEAIQVWPPKFVIALTNKEKEEDFMAIKGSKLPQRPKKRAKFIQRTLNLVCPGSWLCDLTLERYEVREKKITKKRPRGLKAMGNMDSDSD